MKKQTASRHKADKSQKTEDETQKEMNILVNDLKTGFVSPECAMLNRLGELYYEQQEYEKALENFGYALLATKENWDSLGEGIALMNIANTWQILGQQERALANYFFALDNFISSGARFYQTICYCGISCSFFIIGNSDAAKDNAEQARDIAAVMTISPEQQEVVQTTLQQTFLNFENVVTSWIDNSITAEAMNDGKSLELVTSIVPEIILRHTGAVSQRLLEQNQEIQKLEIELSRMKSELREQAQKKVQKQKQSDTVAEGTGEAGGDDKNTMWLAYEKELEWLNPNFTNRFSGVYPTLSRREIRICSMLALQISAKNIAAMLHIEKKAVDKHRQNIRKKMNIPASGDLALHIALFRE